MPDLFLEYNSDLVVTPNGSVQFATGWDHVRQRIVRRVVTNSAQALPDGSTTPPDYIFDPSFGDGLAALVDQDISAQYLQTLTAKIRNGVLADEAVSPGTPPAITVSQPNPNTYLVSVAVTLLDGTPGQVQVQLSQNPVSP